MSDESIAVHESEKMFKDLLGVKPEPTEKDRFLKGYLTFHLPWCRQIKAEVGRGFNKQHLQEVQKCIENIKFHSDWVAGNHRDGNKLAMAGNLGNAFGTLWAYVQWGLVLNPYFNANLECYNYEAVFRGFREVLDTINVSRSDKYRAKIKGAMEKIMKRHGKELDENEKEAEGHRDKFQGNLMNKKKALLWLATIFYD